MRRDILRSHSFLVIFYLLASATFGADSDQGWKIHGRVIDEHDRPTDDFDAATFWWANGNQWDANGERIKPSGPDDMAKMWKDEGTPAADPKDLAQHEGDGKFSIKTYDRPRVSIFALDKARKRGGYVSVEKDAAEKDHTIKLVPLTQVHGTIDCFDTKTVPDFTNATVHPADDKENFLHFIFCGSMHGKFSFPLPAGKYDFDIHSSSPDAHLPKPGELNVPPGQQVANRMGLPVEVPNQPDFDLGVVHLILPRDNDGVPHSYSMYFGKEPPPLSITDARGAPKTVKLSDYRGKWVVLDFWALWCGPCVQRSLPELTKFYDEHSDARDRFEILAICDTKEEKALTIGDYDTRVGSIIKEVWDNKPLKFPVLLDGEGKTCTLYGIQGLPTTLFIDPEGHLVKHGSLEMLAKELESK